MSRKCSMNDDEDTGVVARKPSPIEGSRENERRKSDYKAQRRAVRSG